MTTTLTNIGVDIEQVVPMIEKLQATTGVLPGQVLVDAGYYSAANLDYAKTVEAGSDGRTEFFIATGRPKHGERVPEVPRGRIPANATLRERMARKLKTKRDRAVYARRKAIVEPAFGQIHTRQGKFVVLRGLEQAAHEWDLIARCHNLMKLHTMQTKALLAAPAALIARLTTSRAGRNRPAGRRKQPRLRRQRDRGPLFDRHNRNFPIGTWPATADPRRDLDPYFTALTLNRHY